MSKGKLKAKRRAARVTLDKVAAKVGRALGLNFTPTAAELNQALMERRRLGKSTDLMEGIK